MKSTSNRQQEKCLILFVITEMQKKTKAYFPPIGLPEMRKSDYNIECEWAAGCKEKFLLYLVREKVKGHTFPEDNMAVFNTLKSELTPSAPLYYLQKFIQGNHWIRLFTGALFMISPFFLSSFSPLCIFFLYNNWGG